MKLPGAERAEVDAAKVRDYLLSPVHPDGRSKARVFASLGFRRAEWHVFREALLRHARTGDATAAGANTFGQKYAVRGNLLGPLGDGAAIVSVWIVLHGEHVPQFVTAYPELIE